MFASVLTKQLNILNFKSEKVKHRSNTFFGFRDHMSVSMVPIFLDAIPHIAEYYKVH